MHVFKAFKKISAVKTPTLIWVTLVLTFFSTRISTNPSQSLNTIHVVSCFLLGISVSIYMLKWSSKLVLLKKNILASTMGMMMLLASILYTLLLMINDSSFSVFLAYIFLFLSALFPESKLDQKDLTNTLFGKKGNYQFAIRHFWLPFLMILFSFYFFSFVLLNNLFPTTRAEAPYVYLAATLTYGMTAILGGKYLDRYKKTENIVLLGIIFLGSFYFISSELELVYIVNIGFEISYALIDLFLWVGIAYASITFKYNPVRCFGFGLGMNVFFILIGFLADRWIANAFWSFDFNKISLWVGILMLLCIFPALSMKHINLAENIKHKSDDRQITLPENLTPREKQVFKLLMTKLTNDEIQDKLSISKNTLKTHIRNIYAKSGVKSRYELILKYASQKSRGRFGTGEKVIYKEPVIRD
jgi:DNA-binding CsgD family transcriptional regulator